MNNFYKRTLILVLCLASVQIYAATIDTAQASISPKQHGSNTHKFSSYGSVFLKSTPIMGNYNPQMGGMGAVVFKNKMAAGAFGHGLMQPIEFKGSNLLDSQASNVYLKYGYGGIFVEYFFVRNNKFQFSIPVKLGYGLAGIYSEASDDRLEKSRLIVVEPELHVDVKMGSHLALSAQVGYRLADVDGLYNLTDKQLSGLSVGIGLKFISR